MKRVKKILALCMAVILSMSLVISVSASGETPQDPPQKEGHTITITDKNPGHVYEAYQIFEGAYDPETGILSSIKWGKNFNKNNANDFLLELQKDKSFESNNTNLFSTINNAVTGHEDELALDIAKIMKDWQKDDKMIRRFAEILHKFVMIEENGVQKAEYDYLTGDPVKSSESATEINGEKASVYTISGLDSGYYLVKDEDNSLEGNYDYYTRLLLQVVGDQSITPKGSVPSVDKKVHAVIDGTFREFEDVAITDTFYFKLTGTLPGTYQDYSTYTYEFVDTLSDGIDLVYDETNSEVYWNAIKSIVVEREGEDNNVELFLTTDAAKANDPSDSEDYNAMDSNGVLKRYNLLVATNEDDIVYVKDAEGNELPKTDVLITYDLDNRVFKIKFLDLKVSLPALIPSDKIVVKYLARLNDQAIIGNGENAANGKTGNVNEVYLNFSNNPQGEGTGTTPEADAKVYVYELDIQKVDESGKAGLPDAEFMLYQRVAKPGKDDEYTYAYAVLETVKKTGSEEIDFYRIKDWIVLDETIYGESKDLSGYDPNTDLNYALSSRMSGTGVNATILSVSGEGLSEDGEKIPAANNPAPEGICLDSLTMVSKSTGAIRIQGLDATSYWLQELNAPLNYNILREPVYVVIKADHDNSTGKIISMSVTADSAEGNVKVDEGKAGIPIQNSKGNILPSTGGIGTTIFYVVGGILVAAALVLLVTKKRMSDRA